MKSIKKILLLTDFSEISGYAEDFAVDLAKKLQFSTDIMHLINTPFDWEKIPVEKENLYPEIKAKVSVAKTRLNSLVKKFEANDLSARSVLVYGIDSDNVSSHVESHGIDMIIMGSHGTSGKKSGILGSNTIKMLKSTRVPVMIIPCATPVSALKKILFPSTFESDQTTPYHFIREFASALGATVHLLYVNTPYEFKDIIGFETMVGNFGISGQSGIQVHHIDAYNEEAGIHLFSTRNEINMICIATHSGHLNAFFTTSLTESLLQRVELPLLSIRLNT